jgi:hypothetical protein
MHLDRVGILHMPYLLNSMSLGYCARVVMLGGLFLLYGWYLCLLAPTCNTSNMDTLPLGIHTQIFEECSIKVIWRTAMLTDMHEHACNGGQFLIVLAA